MYRRFLLDVPPLCRRGPHAAALAFGSRLSVRAPEGVLNVGGEWIYDEFAHGNGVASVGLEERAPAPPTEEEKKGILDLFKN